MDLPASCFRDCESPFKVSGLFRTGSVSCSLDALILVCVPLGEHTVLSHLAACQYLAAGHHADCGGEDTIHIIDYTE